ncbi:Thymidylate kinase [subsurface metagenome]
MKKNRAPIIALFGPDGSGKSTIAELLVKRGEEIGIRAMLMHWRPGLLPYRGLNSQESEKRFKDPHSTKLRRGLKGFFLFLYIVVDFIFGYYFLIRPHLRNGTIVLYERYYYDIIFDQRRYGLQVPLSIRSFFAHVLPTPDVIILLDAPVHILQARKQELGRTEIERQRLMMKQYLSCFDSYHLVDVGVDSPDDVADIIFNIVMKYLQESL